MIVTNPVYAPCPVGVSDCGPPPGVTVSTWTDSQFYEKNDTIDLKGKLYVENYTNPIQVQVINPTNMTVQTLEASVINNTFSEKINANFNDSGMYQIVTCVKSWCDRSYFKYTAEPYNLSFNGGNYLIWYKSVADLQKIDVDVGAYALRVHISGATAEGLQFVITLPRDLIDFRSAGVDQNFTVLVGAQQPDKYMQPASFKEISTNSLSRTLAIDIPYKPMSDVQGIWDFKITGPDVLSGLAPEIVYADQTPTIQGWSKYTALGKFLYSEPPRPDVNFIIKYRVLNGAIGNFTAAQGDFIAKVSVSPQTNGTLEIMAPRNYPYTNQVGITGGAKLAIVLSNGTEIPYNVITDDCFFDYSISFSGNEKIELIFPYLVSKLAYHGDEVSPNCIGQTISQNYTQNVNSTVPEFPFAIPILLISITSLIVFYRIRIRK